MPFYFKSKNLIDVLTSYRETNGEFPSEVHLSKHAIESIATDPRNWESYELTFDRRESSDRMTIIEIEKLLYRSLGSKIRIVALP
jgi:hypothetical protein